MTKPRRFVILLLLILSLGVGFALSALQPSWWTRQIEFTWHDTAQSASSIAFTAPDTWFNMYVLIVAGFLLFYFAVVGAGRLYRERRLRDSQTRNDHEQPHEHI